MGGTSNSERAARLAFYGLRGVMGRRGEGVVWLTAKLAVFDGNSTTCIEAGGGVSSIQGLPAL